MMPERSLTRSLGLALFGLVLAAWPAAAQDGETAPQEARPAPYGVWMPEDEESMVEIYECGEAMCGRVVWMLEERDENGEVLTDIYNPDPELRSQPVLGLEIMTEITPTDEDKVWQGRVYNPKDGRTYDFWLTVKSEQQITIQGCGLYNLVCQTHTWNRAES